MTRIFSTLRVRDGRPWFLEDHCRRLGVDVSAHVLEAARGHEDARVRVTVGQGGAPDVTVDVEPYEAPEIPWRLRPVVVSPDGDKVRQKTTDRAMYDEAKRAAGDADDALLHLADGTLLECTIANVFLVFGRRLVTPSADAPLLAGIARSHVVAAASTLGMVVEERRIVLKDAVLADACVVTNALMVCHPVGEICGVATYSSAGLARRLMDAVVPESPQSV